MEITEISFLCSKKKKKKDEFSLGIMFLTQNVYAQLLTQSPNAKRENVETWENYKVT
jgi:hypothetical protein